MSRPKRPSWADVLDDLEARLLALEAVEPIEVRFDEFTPPPGLGPLPAELAERATEILRLTEAHASRVGEAIVATTDARKTVRAMNARGPAPSAHFDLSV